MYDTKYFDFVNVSIYLYYNTNSFFLSFLRNLEYLTYALTAGLFQFINNQGFKWNSFYNFISQAAP